MKTLLKIDFLTNKIVNYKNVVAGFEDRIFCNVHFFGLPEEAWISDFEAANPPKLINKEHF